MARLRKVMLYGKEFERSQCRKESTYLFGLSFTIICSQMWLCGDKPEDLDHVLRSCAMVRSVWLRSIPVAAKALFSALNFKEWLCKNLFDSTFITSDMEWPIRLVVLCWLIWKRRCCLVLAPEENCREDFIARGDRMVEECKGALLSTQQVPRLPIMCSSWNAPPHGWVKLNVDASMSTFDQKVDVGGVLRDEFGLWILGFARFVGRCDVVIADLWAIHDGLLQAWVSGFSRVKLESDCLEAIRIINSLSNVLDGNALVTSIKEFIARDWNVVARHVDRGNNRVAKTLASWGHGLVVAQLIYSVPLADMVSLVEEELSVSTSTVGEAASIG
ncbi:hypothetical protein V6N12_046357 [Hibiscus sabdariffa]|uniref:RNase H type-1 domain-containing protein n=1 Tax=Hibiscus sabdariffa TaxID=183260 RepID=A0ABR2DLB6_9ROSI